MDWQWQERIYELLKQQNELLGQVLNELRASKEQKSQKAQKPKPLSPASAIAHYCELWSKRYGGAHPAITGKDAGLMKSLVKDHGVDKVIGFIDAYLQMPDNWFLIKRHDILTLATSLNAVVHFMSTGKTVTRTELQNIDKAITNKNLMDRVKKGEV